MAGYTYDPSESIKQSFQQASAGIGGIFNQVIQQQQRDYTLAENAFQNIEALKKDLNIFGQKNVTKKANDLLKEAGSSILESGKLDYSKLGEIRQKVSEIKDLKQGYELGAKEYERMLQLGIANKDNMVSFEKFYKELSAKMGDENLVKNPQDLQQALASTYSNNLDASAMFGKSFLKQNPLQQINQDIRNAKGQVIGTAVGQLPAGWSSINGKITPPAPITVTGPDGKPRTLDYIDQQLQIVQQNNPEMWDLMKKQTGFAGTIMNERDIMANYLSKIPMTLNTRETKSENQLRMEEAGVTSAEFQAKVQPQKFAAEMAQSAASIASSTAQAGYYNAQSGMLKGGASGSPVAMYSNTIYDPVGKKNVNYNAFPLEAETPTSITLANGKKERAIVSDVAIGDDGQIYAKVGVRSIQGSDTKRIVKDKNNINDYQFHKIDASAVPSFLRDMKLAAGKSGDKKIKAESLSNINNIEATYNQLKGGNKPTPTTPKVKGITMTDDDILNQMPDSYNSTPEAKSRFIAAFKKLNNIK